MNQISVGLPVIGLTLATSSTFCGFTASSITSESIITSFIDCVTKQPNVLLINSMQYISILAPRQQDRQDNLT
jgi:hypothetical protein